MKIFEVTCSGRQGANSEKRINLKQATCRVDIR